MGRCPAQDDSKKSKEVKLAEFVWKCTQVLCYLHCTEPNSPWSNSSKLEILELKKGTQPGNKLGQVTPGEWCALHWSTFVYSLAHCNWHLQVSDCIPKMVILGETADISPFYEFCFWDWVKFWIISVTVSNKLMGLETTLGHAWCRAFNDVDRSIQAWPRGKNKNIS